MYVANNLQVLDYELEDMKMNTEFTAYTFQVAYHEFCDPSSTVSAEVWYGMQL